MSREEKIFTVVAMIVMLICFALAGKIDTWFLANGIIH